MDVLDSCECYVCSRKFMLCYVMFRSTISKVAAERRDMGCASSAPMTEVEGIGPVPASLVPVVEAMATQATLSLRGTNLRGDASAVPIARALKRSTTLLELELSNCQLFARGAGCIAKALEANPPLSQLVLSSNCIGGWIDTGSGGRDVMYSPQGAKDLIDALKANTNLTSLDLSDNNWSSSDRQALQVALQSRGSTTFNL